MKNRKDFHDIPLYDFTLKANPDEKEERVKTTIRTFWTIPDAKWYEKDKNHK